MEKKGFALVYALALMVLMILMASTFFTIPYNELAEATAAANSVKAYYVAEAGIAKKFMELRAGSTDPLSESFNIFTGETGNYSVSVTLVPDGAFATYRLDSTGAFRGMTRTISLTVRQVSYARYAYLSNDEDMMFWYGDVPIWFVTGDTITGPLHSNDQLNISGNPVFMGPVTTTASSINYYHGGPPTDNPDFRKSLTLGAPFVSLPSSSDILTPIMNAAQQSSGLYLTGSAVITLRSDGTMDVTNAAKGWSSPHNIPLPQNGAVYVDNGQVSISGVLNGQLTVGTNKSIYVVNNLLYHDDPRTNPMSSDMIGLVAQNNVYVDETAPYNMEIDGSMVALNTSFGVESYNVGLKGTLIVYGAITQYRRGPIGTFNSVTGAKVSGYTKNYIYDDRMGSAAPLYYPPAKDAANRIIYVKILYRES